MGVVFKARQIALGRLVTLKTILTHGSIGDEQRRRFLQEAKAMALLQHPNIVQIHEIGQQGDCPFLVMEYVEGENLATRLAGNPWPPRKAAELLAVLARAVQTAHEHGVIHRDLKPRNILLCTDGTPKICDFGLAKHFASEAHATQTGQALGTPSYMAPEQVRGDRDAQGPTVDVYALGAVLYETLTGRPPFPADNSFDTMQLVMGRDPVPPRLWQPKTPRDLETICLKCLAKQRSRHYASARELAEDLSRFLAHEPIHARPAGVVERSWRWCRTHPSLSALAAVAIAALLVVLAIVLAYNRREAKKGGKQKGTFSRHAHSAQFRAGGKAPSCWKISWRWIGTAAGPPKPNFTRFPWISRTVTRMPPPITISSPFLRESTSMFHPPDEGTPWFSVRSESNLGSHTAGSVREANASFNVNRG